MNSSVNFTDIITLFRAIGIVLGLAWIAGFCAVLLWWAVLWLGWLILTLSQRLLDWLQMGLRMLARFYTAQRQE